MELFRVGNRASTGARRVAGSAPLAVTAAALIDAAVGHSTLSQDVFMPLAIAAAVVAGLRERGPRLALIGIAAAVGLAVANQLDPSDRYDFFNDLIFFSVVSIGGPMLVGVAIRRRAELIAGLSARTHRLSAQMLVAEQMTAAEERSRLQRELNQGLTDRVAEIVVQAAGAERVMATDPRRTLAAVGEIELAARAVLDELRSVLGVLRVGDEDLVLLPAPSLQQLERLRRAGAGSLTIEGERAGLDPAVDATAFRVVQQAVANAAAPPDVLIRYGPSAIRVEVAGGRFSGEDGQALDHRVRLFGGRCRQAADALVLELPRRVPW